MRLQDLFETRKAVAEGLNEFAPPGGDGGDDGFSEETLKRMAAQWWNGDEDPRIEKTLAAAGWEIGQDTGYDNGGVFVVQSGDVNGNSYISWPAEELQGLEEGEGSKSSPYEQGGTDAWYHRGFDPEAHGYRPGTEEYRESKRGFDQNDFGPEGGKQY